MEAKMCLILVSYDQHPDYKLIFAANRDEFYDRPTLPLAFWEDVPEIIGGRDMKSNGTWLGVHRTGRFAAVTNYRNPHEISRRHRHAERWSATFSPIQKLPVTICRR